MMTRMKRVLLVGGDLSARARLEAAAERTGAELRTCRPEDAAEAALREPVDLIVVDLDSGRESALEALRDVPARTVGFYSHVDTELAEAAKAAGVEAVPRGRFWRQLDELLR
jgi:DNA-binding response OmpR family regulator